MTKCVNCGAENDPNNRFCEECGSALQLTCQHCGQTVAPNTKFCPSCGNRLAATAGAQASAAPSPASRPSYQPPAPATPPPAAASAAPTVGYAAYGQPSSAPPPAPASAPRPASPPPSSYGGPASSPPPYTPPPASYGASFPSAAPAALGYTAPYYQAAPAFQYKGVWPRFFAQLIDGIIVLAPMSILMAMAMGLVTKSAQPDPGMLNALSVLMPAISLVYFIWLEAGGGTLGKRILGLKIVDAQGNKPGLGRSLARNLLRLIDALPFVIPYLLGIILVGKTRTKQRLGDKAAGTFVVAK